MLGGMTHRPADDDPKPARALPDAAEESEAAEPVRAHRALPPEGPSSPDSPATAVLSQSDIASAEPTRPPGPTRSPEPTRPPSPTRPVPPASQASPATAVIGPPARRAGSPASPNTTVLSGAAVREPDGPDESVEVAAWQHPWVRRLAGARRIVPILALVVGVLAAVACVLLVLRGGLEQAWGLPVLVVAAGLAGGCLAGGVLGLVAYQRLRTVLQSGPWRPAVVELGAGSQAWLLPTDPTAGKQPLELEVRTARLGDRGSRVQVHSLALQERGVLATTDERRLIRAWPGRD